VFYPTWIPTYTFQVYSGRVYPLFCTFKREDGAGQGYELGLYTERRFCDHADRLFELRGIAGNEYAVNTHTHPVWLGKSGWAYIDPDRQSGWTITFVRDVGHSSRPPTYLPEYTYTVLGGCQEVGVPLAHLVACLKRVAASAVRYLPGSSGH
jgi:hypothetical protein